jgi:hypothetical protein
VSGTTTLNNLTVTGNANFRGNITVGGHIITSGNTPTIVAGANAGSGGTVMMCPVPLRSIPALLPPAAP